MTEDADVRIAVGQTAGSPDKEANLAVIAEMVERAASDGADLVAFAEYAMFKQPVRDERFIEEAEPLDGPFADRIRRLARDHGVALVVGMQETILDERRAYNTLLLVDRHGSDVGAYRKIHLYDAFGGTESTWVHPGEPGQQLVFEIDGLRFGTMTCYDIRFPEMARYLTDAGAEVILIPSAWTPGPRKEDHWTTMVRARAIENVAYVVAPGMAPPLATGGSLIVDPMGVVLAEAGEAPTLIAADVTRERVEEVRRKNPALEHRRFDAVPQRESATSAR
jgi:deaminated glutathione amidase